MVQIIVKYETNRFLIFNGTYLIGILLSLIALFQFGSKNINFIISLFNLILFTINLILFILIYYFYNELERIIN